MPTNEERHDVAARLRDIDVKTWHTSWHVLYAIKNACGCYVGQDQQDMELNDRLAELIEPEERTCGVEQDYDAMEDGIPDCRIWRCTCGEAFPYWRGCKPIFCPNCGAKAVDE